MSASLTFVTILGAVCLLLWGLHEVRLGIARAFGVQLHHLISRFTRHRVSAFFSGIGIATLLQSSTAAALLLSSFCAQGLIGTSAGIAVMLGADVGTTLVAQLLSFNLSAGPPVLFIIGFVMFSLHERSGRIGNIGRFLMGLGVMLLALIWIKQTAAPLKDSTLFSLIMGTLDHEPLLALLFTALLTWMMHSSLAVVLLLVSFAAGGILHPSAALIMVLGANLGAIVPPLVATMKDKPKVRHPVLANALIRTAGVFLCLPFAPLIESVVAPLHSDPVRLIVNFHTIFNIGLAVLFLPFTGLLARLSAMILPESKDAQAPDAPRYLDDKAIDTPVIALTAATRETLRIADVLEVMLEETMMALRQNDERLAHSIKKRDDIVDNLYRAIKMYIARMSQETLAQTEAHRSMQVLSFASNLENAGDIIDKSMVPMALKKIAAHRRFSSEGWNEIQEVHHFVIETVRLAQNVFASEDTGLARRLLERKEELRRKEAILTQSHLERIREGIPETITTSAMHLDLIRDYRRINGYMCAAAYPILEQGGQLSESRLLPVDESSNHTP